MKISPKAAKGNLDRMKAERAAQRAPKPTTPTQASKPIYKGASSPISLPDGRGMTAVMASAVQADPSKYPGYSDPKTGTPRYTKPPSNVGIGTSAGIGIGSPNMGIGAAPSFPISGPNFPISGPNYGFR